MSGDLSYLCALLASEKSKVTERKVSSRCLRDITRHYHVNFVANHRNGGCELGRLLSELTADQLAQLVDCWITVREGRRFEPWPDQHSGSLNN